MKLTTANAQQRSLRIALFGKESAGKTHFGLSAPGPVLTFDAEGRIAAMIKAFGDIPLVDYNLKSLARDLVEAANLVCGGEVTDSKGVPFRSLLIDSWTVIEKLFAKASGIDPTSDNKTRVRDLGDLRQRIELQMLNPAFTGPTKAHIIVTAHEALEWEGNGQRVSGAKPDATRNFKHYFDLVFRLEKEPAVAGGATPRRWATVVKSNFQSDLPIGMRIENLSWDTPQLRAITNGVAVATSVSKDELRALYAKAGSPNGDVRSWLTANRISANGTMSAEDSQRAKGMLETLIEEQALLEGA